MEMKNAVIAQFVNISWTMSQPRTSIHTQLPDSMANIIFYLSKEEGQILTAQIHYTQLSEHKLTHRNCIST